MISLARPRQFRRFQLDEGPILVNLATQRRVLFMVLLASWSALAGLFGYWRGSQPGSAEVVNIRLTPNAREFYIAAKTPYADCEMSGLVGAIAYREEGKITGFLALGFPPSDGSSGDRCNEPLSLNSDEAEVVSD